MTEVTETMLPGVGVRHEIVTGSGQRVGVLVHHNGRRELLVYDVADPDACSAVVTLDHDETRTLAELLGATRVTEEVHDILHDIEGQAIEWITVTPGSAAAGATIGDGNYRSRTGASIVTVIRNEKPVPAPGPEFRLEGGDLVVAVGSSAALRDLQALLDS